MTTKPPPPLLPPGAYLRAVREAAQITQAQLAEVCGLHQSRISALETGKAVFRLEDIRALRSSLPALDLDRLIQGAA